MNEAKHTPGPWTLGNTLAPFGITIWKEHDPERNTPRICQNVSTMANANLISAAPELLEACKLAERYYLPTPVLIALRNAIAKAEL